MGPLVAEALGAGKGGGRPGLFQGKCQNWNGLEAAKALLAADRAQSALLVQDLLEETSEKVPPKAHMPASVCTPKLPLPNPLPLGSPRKAG